MPLILSPIFKDPVYPTSINIPDLNYDIDTRESLTSSFFKKAKRWMAKTGGSYQKNILPYLYVKDKNADVVNSMSDVSKNNNRKMSDDDKTKSIKFLFDYILTKQFLGKVLEGFRLKTNVNWYDLLDHKTNVKKYILKKTIKKLKSEVEKGK